MALWLGSNIRQEDSVWRRGRIIRNDNYAWEECRIIMHEDNESRSDRRKINDDMTGELDEKDKSGK